MRATGVGVPSDNANVLRPPMKYLLVQLEEGRRTVLRAYKSLKRAKARKSLMSLQNKDALYAIETTDGTSIPEKGG